MAKDSLAQQLDEFRDAVANNMPAEMQHKLQGAIDKLIASKIHEQALSEGDTFPDFALSNATGKTIKRDSLLAEGPLIVNFYRGSWCPYCNFELQAYQQLLPQITAAGGQLVAVSPQLPDHSLDTAEKNQLQFEVLSDHNNVLADQLGIRFDFDESLRDLYQQMQIDLGALHGVSEWQLPVPATYVVDKNSKIVFADINADYTYRTEPSEALEALIKTE